MVYIIRSIEHWIQSGHRSAARHAVPLKLWPTSADGSADSIPVIHMGNLEQLHYSSCFNLPALPVSSANSFKKTHLRFSSCILWCMWPVLFCTWGFYLLLSSLPKPFSAWPVGVSFTHRHVEGHGASRIKPHWQMNRITNRNLSVFDFNDLSEILFEHFHHIFRLCTASPRIK